MEFDAEFCKEEVRCGYTISEKMKKVWSVEIDLVKQLIQVCEKYGLKYYADSGTLLGAVRHKGFIPWDDDIDIVMFREDYEKLLSVAEKEFKYPYYLQHTYNDENYCRGHAQLRNSDTTGCIIPDIDASFNKGIFIDIFPMDCLPDNDITLYFFKKEVKTYWRIMYATANYDKSKPHSLKQKIARPIIKILKKNFDLRRAFKKYEKICSKYNKKNTKRVSYIEFSLGKERCIWEKTWFDESIKVEFEGMEINIPIGYDKLLTKMYGNYMEMVKAPTAHGVTIFEPEIPYKEYFKQESREVRNE